MFYSGSYIQAMGEWCCTFSTK